VCLLGGRRERLAEVDGRQGRDVRLQRDRRLAWEFEAAAKAASASEYTAPPWGVPWTFRRSSGIRSSVTARPGAKTTRSMPSVSQ
jgi:hypothetical protein